MSMTPEQLEAFTDQGTREAVPSSGTLLCVTWGNNGPNTRRALTAPNLYHAFRFPYITGPKAVASLVVDVQNFYAPFTGDADTGNSVFIDSMAIENEAVDATAPVMFGGLRTKTLTDGATEQHSSAILPSALGYSDVTGIPPDTKLWLKGIIHVANTGEFVPAGRVDYENEGNNPGGLLQTLISTGADISGTDTLGPYTGGAGNLSVGFTPLLLGTFVGTDGRSILLLGDSITESGLYYSQMKAALINSDFETNAQACTQIAVGGQTIEQIISSTMVKTRGYFKYFNTVWTTLGTNGTGTLIGQMQNLWELFEANCADGARICSNGVPPQSTDPINANWVAPETNQVPTPNSWQSEWYNMTNFVADIGRSRAIDFYNRFAVNSSANIGVRGTTEPYYWFASATPFLATADGTHPSNITEHAQPYGQSMMWNASRPLMNAWRIQNP